MGVEVETSRAAAERLLLFGEGSCPESLLTRLLDSLGAVQILSVSTREYGAVTILSLPTMWYSPQSLV